MEKALRHTVETLRSPAFQSFVQSRLRWDVGWHVHLRLNRGQRTPRAAALPCTIDAVQDSQHTRLSMCMQRGRRRVTAATGATLKGLGGVVWLLRDQTRPLVTDAQAMSPLVDLWGNSGEFRPRRTWRLFVTLTQTTARQSCLFDQLCAVSFRSNTRCGGRGLNSPGGNSRAGGRYGVLSSCQQGSRSLRRLYTVFLCSTRVNTMSCGMETAPSNQDPKSAAQPLFPNPLPVRSDPFPG